MHRILETDPRRPEMIPRDNRGGFQFGGRRENDGARNSMIGEEAGVPHAVARFVTLLLGRRIYARANQRMEPFGNFPDPLSINRTVLYPVTFALEGVGGQRYSPP